MSETPAGCCRTDRRLAEARWGADSRCGRAAAAQGFLAGPSGELPAAGVDGAQGHSAGRVLGRRAAPSPCPPHAAALPAYHGRFTSLQASGRLAAGDAGHSLSSRLAPACFAASEGLRALPLPRPECTRRPAGCLVCCGVQKLQPPASWRSRLRPSRGRPGCTGAHVANTARLEGRTPPVLYTLARDGALHSFVYDRPAAPPALPPHADSSDDENGAGGDAAASPPQPPFTGAHGARPLHRPKDWAAAHLLRKCQSVCGPRCSLWLHQHSFWPDAPCQRCG